MSIQTLKEDVIVLSSLILQMETIMKMMSHQSERSLMRLTGAKNKVKLQILKRLESMKKIIEST